MTSKVLAILKKQPIVDYLEKMGHNPVKRGSNGRYFYLCPFPDHKESKPSFVVWTNSEYQNFRCFGCMRNYHLIHLVSALENISYKDAIKTLCKDMEFPVHETTELGKEIITNSFVSNIVPLVDLVVSQTSQLSKDMLDIASLCRQYVESVEYDPYEVKIIDGFLGFIDKSLKEIDFDTITEYVKCLDKMLYLRKQEYKKRKANKFKADFNDVAGNL